MVRTAKPVWLYIALISFWAGVGVLGIVQSLISYSLNDWDLQWPTLLARNLGWPVWMLLTPPTLWVAGRLPFRATTRRAVVRFVGVNLVVAAGIAGAHFGLEFLIKYPLWVRYIDPNPGPHEFYAAFFYRYHVNILVALFIAGVAHAFDFLEESKEHQLAASKLEAQLARAQVQALRQQLQPHFLFNTHHSIIGMMLSGKNEAAIKMLTRLSDLLRMTLASGERQFTTVRAEIEVLELYLTIHLIRLGDRLTVDFDIARSVMEAKTPSLLLQPIVENALKHGIEPFTGAGSLRVHAHRDDDLLVFEVHDNGPGFQEHPPPKAGEGLGLRNTRARLQQLYGDSASVTFAHEEGGFVARLAFPFESGQDA